MANATRTPPRGGSGSRQGGGAYGGGPPRPRTQRPAGRPGGGAPAPTRTPSQVSPKVNPRPGRLGGLLLPQVVLVELAAALVLIPFATNRWVGIGTMPVAAALLAIAVARRKQRWFIQWWPVMGEHRRRQRVPSSPAANAEPGIAPLLETSPTLRTFSVTSRSRDNVGMIGDGSFLTAVLHLETKDEPLRAPRHSHPLSLQSIASVLTEGDTSLAAIQVVQHTQSAPAPHLPTHALASRSYTALKVDVPAIRATWIALRLDPERSRVAVAARGGGLVGAQRALLKSVHAAISELDVAGFDAAPLTEPELISALGAACSINPLVGTQLQANPNARRTRETWRVWRCDDRWHTTFWVRRLPQLARATAADTMAVLSATPALASTLSLTATAAGGGAVSFDMHVRLAARSENELAEAIKQLEANAKRAGFGLVRLDGEQLPGLLATLPLGGVSG